MSKKLKRDLDESDQLRKEVRELKIMNRSLQKRLKKLDRNYEASVEEALKEIEENKEVHEQKEKAERCLQCARGTIETVDILGRVFKRCTICDFRSRSSKAR